jgi:hypothetical protein
MRSLVRLLASFVGLIITFITTMYHRKGVLSSGFLKKVIHNEIESQLGAYAAHYGMSIV